jgi:tellurite resistance protein TehA-like permease
MSTPDHDAFFEASLRTMRIIVAALVAGVVTFLVIAVYLRQAGRMPAPPEMPTITYIAVPFGLSVVAAYSFLPNAVAAGARRRIAQGIWYRGPHAPALGRPLSDREKLLVVYNTRLIVGAALLESVAFYLLIAYLLEGIPWSLAGAVLFAGGIAAQFPTRPGVERWLEAQMDLLQQERVHP